MYVTLIHSLNMVLDTLYVSSIVTYSDEDGEKKIATKIRIEPQEAPRVAPGSVTWLTVYALRTRAHKWWEDCPFRDHIVSTCRSCCCDYASHGIIGR